MEINQKFEQVVDEVIKSQDVEGKTDWMPGTDGRRIKLYGYDRMAVYLGLPRDETIEMVEGWPQMYGESDWRPYLLGLIYSFFDTEDN